MNARRTWLIQSVSSLALCLLTLLILFNDAQSIAAAYEPPPDGKKIGLKVLYAGNQSSPRAADFKNFLKVYFSSVTVIGLPSLDKQLAQEHDVVVVDWTSIYKRRTLLGKINAEGGISMPPTPILSEDYAHPTVLIGAAGARAVQHLQLKIDWL